MTFFLVRKRGSPRGVARRAAIGLLVSVALGFLGAASPGTAAPPPLRILIFTGQNNHEWRQTTPQLKSILEAGGRFTVETTEHPADCTGAALARFDAVLSNWNTYPAVARVKEWPARVREDFLSFVRNGGGLVVVHAGGSSFESWPEYRQLVVAWGKGTGHGPIHSFEVKIAAPDHPVTRGLAPFRTTDELWHRAEWPANHTVLATAFSARDKGGSGQEEPVAVVSEFGKGRCFNLVLGHNVAAMEAAGFRALLQRGTEWAASGKVTLGNATRAAEVVPR